MEPKNICILNDTQKGGKETNTKPMAVYGFISSSTYTAAAASDGTRYPLANIWCRGVPGAFRSFSKEQHSCIWWEENSIFQFTIIWSNLQLKIERQV